MAPTIPSEPTFALDLLGVEWPGLDEDEIHSDTIPSVDDLADARVR